MEEKNKTGTIIFTILSIVPLILWLFATPISERFTDLSATTTSIGQVLGLVGIAMFSISFISAAKFEFLSKLFGDHEEQIKNHKIFGALSFTFLLLHPVLLSVKYALASLPTAYLFFKPTNDTVTLFGTLALGLMMLILIFALYIHLNGRVFKAVHRLMIFPYLIGIFHSVISKSTVSSFAPLRFYLAILATLAIISFLYIIIKKPTLIHDEKQGAKA